MPLAAPLNGSVRRQQCWRNMRGRKKEIIALILVLLYSSATTHAQSRLRTDLGADRVDTIAGPLRVIHINEKKMQLRLRNKLILTVTKKRHPSIHDLNEISIYDVVKHRISPFDEVIILNNWRESFTGCRPGVFFLGLKKDGTYQFSKSTPNCIDRQMRIKRDRIEIRAVPDVHTTEYMYLPIPGGKWVYRNGVLHTIKLIILPDPRPKQRRLTMRSSGAREAQFLHIL
jgi:hypothetical protein